jgi:hypothetical protein
MKISFRSREDSLESYLPEFRRRALSYENTALIPRRTLRYHVSGAPSSLTDCDLDFFFSYDLFPRDVLRFFGQWQAEGRRGMRAGDVIVQQAQVPPGWGPRLIFGARVLSVFRRADAAGFTYGTLEGHPECGTNEFSFVLDGGYLLASVRTAARSALPAVVPPSLVTSFADHCNRRALKRMVRRFVLRNAPRSDPAFAANLKVV